jgi:hypothetical protein
LVRAASIISPVMGTSSAMTGTRWSKVVPTRRINQNHATDK